MIFPENALLAMYWITRGYDALTELDTNVLRSSVFTMHETANVPAIFLTLTSMIHCRPRTPSSACFNTHAHRAGSPS